MNEMNELRRIYESTEIPPELSDMVSKALNQNQNQNENGIRDNIKVMEHNQGESEMNGTTNTTNRKHRRLYRNLTAAAAAFAVLFGAFGVGVASNEAFAASVSDIPVLGSLVRIFVGEQIDETDSVIHVDVKLPQVEGLTDKKLEDQVNKEIHDKMTAVVEETKQRAVEDKKAWLATGGKEEDYMLREVSVDYRVFAINDDVLSFVVEKTETSASAYFEQHFYNIDLKNSKALTLADLLGDDYINVANEQIKAEIAVRSQNPDNSYFDGSEGVDGFTTIAADQNFYVNENGNVVIVFNKYEIAPGSMGIQEFEITK